MADNITIPPTGSGTATPNVATDDVGGVHFQKVKLDLGGDGLSSPVSGSVPVNDNASSLTVDGSVSLAAAIPAGTNNIGDVDVLTVPAPLSTTGGGVEAAALRVTIASDSTGVLSVDDNGASLTVDGTVTANAGTNLNTSALALEAGGNLAAAAASLAVLDNVVSGSEAQVDVVAALPAGNNNIGDVDVASIAAGTNLIGRVNINPQTGNGLSIFRSLDLDETEEQVSASACAVYGWFITNAATATRYVKFYNDTAANVTVGTTTPVITLPIPGNSSDDISANALGAMGIAFGTALTLAATTGLADSDTGAPGANEVIINLFYI